MKFGEESAYGECSSEIYGLTCVTDDLNSKFKQVGDLAIVNDVDSSESDRLNDKLYFVDEVREAKFKLMSVIVELDIVLKIARGDHS